MVTHYTPDEVVEVVRPRLTWVQLPTELRAEIEAILEARVVAVTEASAGFGPGMASVLTLADGRRCFAKAAHLTDHPDTAQAHRAEGDIAVRLPLGIPSPRFAWAHSDEDWVVLTYEAVEGRRPETPWATQELARMLTAVTQLGRTTGAREIALAPTGSVLATLATGWRAMSARPTDTLDQWVGPWAATHLETLADLERSVLVACEGESFVHGDICADNVLLTNDDVFLVDWATVTRGARWLDLAMLLPTVLAQGVRGLFSPVRVTSSAQEVTVAGDWATETFDSHPMAEDVHPGDLRAVVAGIAGYYLEAARRMAVPRQLRRLQHTQGVAAIAWLRQLGID